MNPRIEAQIPKWESKLILWLVSQIFKTNYAIHAKIQRSNLQQRNSWPCCITSRCSAMILEVFWASLFQVCNSSWSSSSSWTVTRMHQDDWIILNPSTCVKKCVIHIKWSQTPHPRLTWHQSHVLLVLPLQCFQLIFGLVNGMNQRCCGYHGSLQCQWEGVRIAGGHTLPLKGITTFGHHPNLSKHHPAPASVFLATAAAVLCSFDFSNSNLHCSSSFQGSDKKKIMELVVEKWALLRILQMWLKTIERALSWPCHFMTTSGTWGQVMIKKMRSGDIQT